MSTHSQSLVFTLVLTATLLAACSDQSGPAIEESEDAAACRRGAESMINVAREAVADTNSRPERRESRRVLMEGWITRLATGEDPCAIYGDIMRASTTF